jgi:hypothetical protein
MKTSRNYDIVLNIGSINKRIIKDFYLHQPIIRERIFLILSILITDFSKIYFEPNLLGLNGITFLR